MTHGTICIFFFLQFIYTSRDIPHMKILKQNVIFHYLSLSTLYHMWHEPYFAAGRKVIRERGKGWSDLQYLWLRLGDVTHPNGLHCESPKTRVGIYYDNLKYKNTLILSLLSNSNQIMSHNAQIILACLGGKKTFLLISIIVWKEPRENTGIYQEAFILL